MFGVYRILNKVTGKFYVGSTIRAFEIRFKGHRKGLNLGDHPNRYLQRAYDKYGLDVFSFEILEEVKDRNKRAVLDREQYWLDKYWNTGLLYNLCQKAGNVFGLVMTEKSRQKMRKKHRRLMDPILLSQQMSERLIGHETTEETRQKMRGSNKGKKHNFTPEGLQRIIDATKSRLPWNFGLTKDDDRVAKNAEGVSIALIDAWKDPVKRDNMTRNRTDMTGRHKNKVLFDATPRVLVSPTGERFEVTNLDQFCHDNNLRYLAVRSLIIGKRNYYKGWSIGE